MPKPHSSVNYVEPNYSAIGQEYSGGSFVNWALDDGYERAPRLEDYSIMVNLEVEVCSRKNISKNETITKDVLILSFTTKQNDEKSVVNFMGGTKVECSDEQKSSVNYLTTNYADMYVGDLVNYGTTEMIGIKSIDIQYEKSCVPIINIKFTDVRGMSLFQPTELSRTNAYQGIGGINADNVAQSFFQCFFKVPMPKFTITIKGFYGKPVTYEVLCDKFETGFDSSTGNFDIDTRFIGYSYSFLTDISVDALLSAPYSDYAGGRIGNYNKYWQQQIDAGRFVIPQKDGSIKKIPTMFEMFQTVDKVLNDNETIDTVVTDEDKNHTNEISELKDLKDKYTLWYTTLFNICCERFGKEFCYLFTENGCNYRLLILTNVLTEDLEDLSYEYERFPDTFKELNRNLNTAITNFNSKDTAFKKIDNVSVDFKSYKRSKLFKRLFVNGKNNIVFNGFDNTCNLPQTDVFSKVFRGVEYDNAADAEQHKNHVLGTLYNDGVYQYIDCYVVDVDYRIVDSRINALQADANRNPEEREQERKAKAFNDRMLEKLEWYPSVENFTKIMMAHLETLMYQMYTCVSECEGRKASELGVNPSENLDMRNVKEDPEIPPFPRVYRATMGSDGLNKNEDTWVGEFTNGIGFREVDFIDGLFNGANMVNSLYNSHEESNEEYGREINESQDSPIIKHPLSSFDFYITKSPYGSQEDINNDTNGYALAGRIAIRMFNVLGLNYFRKEFGNEKFSTIYKPEIIGKIEADNFYDTVRLTNENIRQMIKNGAFSGETIWKMVTSVNADAPWGKKSLFYNESNAWLTRYSVNPSDSFYRYNTLYPIQNVSFGDLDEAYAMLCQSGKITNCSGNASLWQIPDAVSDVQVNTSDDYGYGTTYIIEDISKIAKQLDEANSDADSGYTDVYNNLMSACSFDASVEKFNYNDFAYVDGRFSVSKKYVGKNKILECLIGSKKSALKIEKEEKFECSNKEMNFTEESKIGNFNSITINEVFGIKSDGKNGYTIDVDSSAAVSINSINPLSGLKVGGHEMTSEMSKATLALMGILLNTNKIGAYLCNSKTVTYIPKLAALQIGAIIFASGGIHANQTYFKNGIRGNAKRYLPVAEDKYYSDKLFEYISSLSKPARHQYEKYYLDWLTNNSRNMSNIYSKDSKCYFKIGGEDKYNSVTRKILNQNNSFIKDLTNDLLKAVCVVRLSFNHEKYLMKRDGELTINDAFYEFKDSLTKGDAIKYLDAFIARLAEKYNIEIQKDKDGNIIQTTQNPNNTTIDMKKELYRYMKQIYDKWIPMSPLKNWEIESFFDRNKEGLGHKFYFIDSFYNDIGQKLLVNPKIVADKVRALLESKDINIMMLGFMSDMYVANKSMLMVLQNFADLRKKEYMDEFFTPISYNSIQGKDINKYSSFVVVYPYQPSRNLDVNNGEYANDGFMLNDEFETPLAIKTKCGEEKGHYNIPAFGVSYAKQYQSYFKKVNVNMKSPIATEQAIRAKHAILLGHNGNKTVVSQDLYDVYATQSYTCDVEMMGCAWVQPLMYFVLLNIPMFRGSYLIMKVRHSIKPGDMTTTFTGCRMANVTDTLVENIFTDGKDPDATTRVTEFSDIRQTLANIDNDCPYKIYPLFGISADISEDEMENAQNAMDILIKTYGFTKSAAAGICGNIYKESTWRLHAKNGIGAFGLCQWLGDRKALLIKKYGQMPSFNQQLEYIDYEWKNEAVAKSHKDELMNTQNTPEQSAYIVRKYFERPGEGEADDATRQSKARVYFNSYKEGEKEFEAKTPNDKTNDAKELAKAFFEAVNKSAKDTPSIRTELKNLGVDNKGYLKINQLDGKTDKLSVVFDMILNSEYYDYVQELGWVYPNGGMQTEVAPAVIYCKVVEKPKNESKEVWAIQYGEYPSSRGNNKIPTGDGSSNPLLLKSLAKRRIKMGNDNNFKKEVPQIDDVNGLDKYKPQNCDDLVNSMDSESYSNNVNGVGSKFQPSIKVGNWDAGKAANFLIQNTGMNSKHICAFAVQQGIIAGGTKPANGNGYRTANGLSKLGWTLVSSGKTDSSEFQNFVPSVGDVMGMTEGKNFNTYGHICMFCGTENGWISDFKQKLFYEQKLKIKKGDMYSAYVYHSKGPGTYWIYRYSGNSAESTTQKPSKCYNGKCLG